LHSAPNKRFEANAKWLLKRSAMGWNYVEIGLCI
jgi:hypothetical protein